MRSWMPPQLYTELMGTMQTLSIAEARRIALAAQQFAPEGAAPKTVRAVSQIVRRLGVVQIDSVNVLVRSHYLPIYSRRGAYSMELLERAAYADRERTLFEYWGHEASLLPVELYPLFRWRMERAKRGEGTWGRLRRYASEHKALVDGALAQIREVGALGASELANSGRSSGAWWGWSQGKEILEWLFWTGEVTTARDATSSDSTICPSGCCLPMFTQRKRLRKRKRNARSWRSRRVRWASPRYAICATTFDCRRRMRVSGSPSW